MDMVISARGQAIQALKEMLAMPESSASDEVIAAVVKLAISDICYAETQDLQVHADGVHEMTRLRGGLPTLGMHGVLAKIAILVDWAIALSLESPSSFSDQEISGHADHLRHTTPTTGSTSPLELPDPDSRHTSLPPDRLEHTTVAMLKDVEFLLDAVLALPQAPSQWQLRKVQSMSEWVHGRLSGATEQTSSTSPLHHAARLASLLYCRTIEAREPFSRVIHEGDVAELVDAVWKVPLDVWNNHLDTLLWVLATVLPTARNMAQFYTTKTMMMAAAVQLLVADWNAAAAVLSRVVKLQAWLRTCPQD
ncbi:hypothetical protein MFIFM68171_08626 [Madurella fahalii]|uniref:Uncharacterized protein n=1 Tax=Madurella fahalii TaxID=1157608 RepID=A0ABQ0GL04_9PEZI